MLKRFRYRAYATRPEQVTAVNKTFGCARVVFNDVVRAREDAHRSGGAFPKSGELSRRLITEAKLTPEREWLSEVSAVVLQQALADADRAYRNFFQSHSGKRKGPRMGVPRKKSKHDSRQSARFTRNARFKIRVANSSKAMLYLPGIGELALAYSRPLPSEPSSVTLIREADGNLYVSFVVDVRQPEPLPVTGRHAALDHAHKLASTLVRENQTISVEQLNVKGLARAGAKGKRGRGNRKSVHDAAWGQFLRVLAEKADWHGRAVIPLDPAYTSQTCSVCGVPDGPKPLSVREWECQDCHAVLDRDFNAATNLLVAAGHAETLNACGGDIRLVLARADSRETGTPHTAAA